MNYEQQALEAMERGDEELALVLWRKALRKGLIAGDKKKRSRTVAAIRDQVLVREEQRPSNTKLPQKRVLCIGRKTNDGATVCRIYG